LSRPARNLHLLVRLSIPPAARLWVTGASGAGKSSLLRLLTGAEVPQSGGLFTAEGPLTARHVTRAAALVPQFHDNHVFNGSFAYNLLLARAWPPAPADLTEALATAQALGLGPLIDRMPGGLSTHLGETGWQLSQGERSRLFLARAILQGAPVLALDESLAALDPITEAECLTALETICDAIVLVRHG
jgi:ATP-binding cassette subfamily B protein